MQGETVAMRQFTGAAATDRSVASTAHRREKGSQWEALTTKNHTGKGRGGEGVLGQIQK